MSAYAIVDSGTTTTRVRILRDGKLVWSDSRSVGARDTAVDGNTDKVRSGLKALLAAASGATGVEPEAVICSGMITSNMGLLEVPHLAAPAGPDDVARGVVQKRFPDLSSVPLSFIPGVKTLPQILAMGTLAGGDVLRGEEAEIVGLRSSLVLNGATCFLHIGSHHKAIDVDDRGRILASRSAITGELLAAVAGNTILKSSVAALENLELDLDAALRGVDAALEHGLGRALFLVRVGEQLAGYSRVQMTSYLIGALAALDLPLLPPAERGATIVVYGTGAFPELLAALLPQHGWRDVRLVDTETASTAALHGAVELFERARRLGAVA
jgi:2-dehydro-3-deoxygalactonokinase